MAITMPSTRAGLAYSALELLGMFKPFAAGHLSIGVEFLLLSTENALEAMFFASTIFLPLEGWTQRWLIAFSYGTNQVVVGIWPGSCVGRAR